MCVYVYVCVCVCSPACFDNTYCKTKCTNLGHWELGSGADRGAQRPPRRRGVWGGAPGKFRISLRQMPRATTTFKYMIAE